MELDRASIERRDFPVRRRGYDPDAVAAHLAAIAEAAGALRGAAPAPLAATAADQVRDIVGAAERSAAELRGQAEREREELLQAARLQAQEHLERVAQSTAAVLERVDSAEREVHELLEAVRAGISKLTRDLLSQDEAADELSQAPAAAPERGPEVDPAADPAQEEGARLVALNMALGGAPREEAERYLAEHFDGLAFDNLLDDVYIRAGQ